MIYNFLLVLVLGLSTMLDSKNSTSILLLFLLGKTAAAGGDVSTMMSIFSMSIFSMFMFSMSASGNDSRSSTVTDETEMGGSGDWG